MTTLAIIQAHAVVLLADAVKYSAQLNRELSMSSLQQKVTTQ